MLLGMLLVGNQKAKHQQGSINDAKTTADVLADALEILDGANRCPEEILLTLKDQMGSTITALCQEAARHDRWLTGRLIATGSFHEGTQVGAQVSRFDLDYLWQVDALSQPFTHLEADMFAGQKTLKLRYADGRDVNLRELRDRFAAALHQVFSDVEWRNSWPLETSRLKLDSVKSTAHEVGLVKFTFLWQSAKLSDTSIIEVDLSPSTHSTDWEFLQSIQISALQSKLLSCREHGFHILPSVASHAAGVDATYWAEFFGADTRLQINSPICEQLLLGPGENALKQTYRTAKILRDLFLGSGKKKTYHLPPDAPHFQSLMQHFTIQNDSVPEVPEDVNTVKMTADTGSESRFDLAH